MTAFLTDFVLTGTVLGLDHTSTGRSSTSACKEAVAERGASREEWPRTTADDHVAYGASARRVEVLTHRETRTVETVYGMSFRSPWATFPARRSGSPPTRGTS